MASHVIVHNLKKSYGRTQAVADVSLEIGRGEIFGLLGQNGAGKTTSIECVLGLRVPDSGYIEVSGIDIHREPRAYKKKVGAVLQNTGLQAQITPYEALSLFASFYKDHADASALLTRFSLSDQAHTAFSRLSGGQQQRLALALAFVNKPELVILDEPTAGLDPGSRDALRDEIRRIRTDNHTVLLSTHYLDEAEALCDRIAVLHQGRVIAIGSPTELITRSKSSQSISFTTVPAVEPAWLELLPAVKDFSLSGNSVVLHSAHPQLTLSALLAMLNAQQIELLDLHVSKTTLHEAFIELTSAA